MPAADIYAKNLDKLADILEAIPDNQHNQRTWATATHQCGTVGCALGWAVMSGKFKGLRYAIRKVGTMHAQWATTPEEASHSLHAGYGILPLVNGQNQGWLDVSHLYFGYGAYTNVFMQTSLNKAEAITALRRQATRQRLGQA